MEVLMVGEFKVEEKRIAVIQLWMDNGGCNKPA